jgi:putative membrane protein
VAVGLVVRGFSAYFLERGGVFDPFVVTQTDLGVVEIQQFTMESGQRLAMFILAGILISLIGVRIAAYVSQNGIERELAE